MFFKYFIIEQKLESIFLPAITNFAILLQISTVLFLILKIYFLEFKMLYYSLVSMVTHIVSYSFNIEEYFI